MTHSYQEIIERTMAETGWDDPVWADNDKVLNRELGELAGLKVPDLLQGPCSLKAMTEPDSSAVIKPVTGCSTKGIVPLLKNESGFVNLFTGKKTTWASATAEALAEKHTPRNLRLLERGHPDAVRSPWILEELVTRTGKLSYDWKAYCFGGRVEAIIQILRDPRQKYKKIKWWGRDWEPLGDIQPTVRTTPHTPKLPMPDDPNGLIEAFESVAFLVDSPFIRVDLYESDSGIVFGETTPFPTGGTSRFNAEWDARLGEAWFNAL